MKIGIMTIVLNGGDYLSYSLMNTLSCFNGIDVAIAVVEGADRFAVIHNQGKSVDGTDEIVSMFSDLIDIRYVRMGLVEDKRVLRNKALELLSDCSIIIIKDHDEFCKRQDIIALLNQFSNDVKGVNVKHVMLAGDMHTKVIEAEAGYLFRAFINDRLSTYTQWHIYPNIPNLQDSTININECRLYHAGYVCPSLRIREKRIHHQRQNRWYYIDNGKPFTDMNTILSLPIICNLTEPLSDILPDELYAHPYYKLSAEEISNYPNAYPTFIIGQGEELCQML